MPNVEPAIDTVAVNIKGYYYYFHTDAIMESIWKYELIGSTYYWRNILRLNNNKCGEQSDKIEIVVNTLDKTDFEWQLTNGDIDLILSNKKCKFVDNKIPDNLFETTIGYIPLATLKKLWHEYDIDRYYATVIINSYNVVLPLSKEQYIKIVCANLE